MVMSEKLKEQLKEEIRKYKLYDTDLKRYQNLYQNYRDSTKQNVINIMDMLGIDKMDGVKITRKKVMPSIDVKKLKECFNDESMADLIVVNVDIEKSIENIMLKNGYNRHIAKGILELLLELNEYQIDELEILK